MALNTPVVQNKASIKASLEVQIWKNSYVAAEAFDSQKLRKADLSPPAMASSNSVDRLTRPSSVSRC